MIETMSESTTIVDFWRASYVQLIAQVTPEQWAVTAVVAMAVLIYCACE